MKKQFMNLANRSSSRFSVLERSRLKFDSRRRFQNPVAAEVTRLKFQEERSLLTSAATVLQWAPQTQNSNGNAPASKVDFRANPDTGLGDVAESPYALKEFDRSCQYRPQRAGREARPATPGAGVLPNIGIRVELQQILTLVLLLLASSAIAAELGDTWGTAEREAAYYRIVNLPIPEDTNIEAGSFATLPDGRLAIGTRRGDLFLVSGAFEKHPRPTFKKFASGLDEALGLAYRDGAFYVTQQTEVTRITDTDGDGRADKFETLSDVWGFNNYHEFAMGSKFDQEGNLWVALCLSKSYTSDEKFRGWALKITPDGKTIPMCSGIRSPLGVGMNEHGVMFYAESQGPWNGSCSLKHLKPGGFMGHPVSFNWYPYATNMGPVPVMPNTRSRLEIERQRVKELVPYAVVFPFKKMGRSISAFEVNRSRGKFGPFENQIFIGDYTLSIVMRATTEEVNGVWQGACYPFREGLATGILAVHFTPNGQLIAGGTNRGWPVRGMKNSVLQRLDWTGKVPFEMREISARSDGFLVTFTRPVNKTLASKPEAFELQTYTHIYQQGYGSPEVDQTVPVVTATEVALDGLSVRLRIKGLVQGHVHEFHVPSMAAADGEPLLHTRAYYTLNEIPNK